jgi:hypothetical protein
MTSLRMRYFNQEGIDEFERHLTAMEDRGARHSIVALLEDSALTTPLGRSRSLDVQEFSDRFHCGRYFYKKIETASEELKAAGVNPVGHRGLWTWFAAAWLEHLLFDSKGNFFVGARERYILSTSARRDYRHLLYGPWLLYTAALENPDLVQIALCDRVTKDSAVFEQLASRKEIVSNISALKLINKCYRDTTSGTVYPQATRGDIAGGLRRFGAVYSQLAVNFDLQNMSDEQIQNLLPAEFAPWLNGSPPAPPKKGRSPQGRN